MMIMCLLLVILYAILTVEGGQVCPHDTAPNGERELQASLLALCVWRYIL